MGTVKETPARGLDHQSASPYERPTIEYLGTLSGMTRGSKQTANIDLSIGQPPGS